MQSAHFRASGGRFDGANEATVEVDRERGLVTVRPLRRRQAYTVTLAEVAEFVIWRSMRNGGVPIPKARPLPRSES